METGNQNSHRIKWLVIIMCVSIFGTTKCNGLIRKSSSQNFVQTIFEGATNKIFFNETIPDIQSFRDEYDFIVIGSGSAGSVVANRLTEINDWNVLVLEAGGTETAFTDVPLAAPYTQLTSFNWGFTTEKSKNFCSGLVDGVCRWPKGRGIGGTSVINYLLYTRGNRRDYNEWAEMGNDGWGYDDVLEYFKKAENPKLGNLTDPKYRGSGGNLDVEFPGYRTALLDAFLEGGKELGYKNGDINGEEQLGFGQAQATMRNGRRCSTSKAYIRPIIRRKNLHISQKSWVTKILIDPKTKTAYGVEFLKNRKRHTVKASKEVILSGGAIGSPHILMLSGIGPRENLEEVGVEVIQDLKVGHNLQDHVSLPALVFTVNESITIIDTELINATVLTQFLFSGKGPLTLPGGAEGVAFIKTPSSKYPADFPDIELVMGAGGINSDTAGGLRIFSGITNEFYEATYKGIIGKHGFTVAPTVMRSKSRGRISLKSKNPFHWPRMQPNYLDDPDDILTMIEGIKFVLDLINTKGFKKYNAKLNPIPFFGCEKPTFGSDEYWDCCIRAVVLSFQHQAGTCKMGPASDKDAVVDPELKVHGIKNLRVVDLSITPILPASHTNAVAIMIGEKASDMVKKTHGKL